MATLTNKLVPDADVTLMSVIAGVTRFAKTDANGRFTFDGIFLTDSLKFTVQARGPKNTDKVKVLIDSVPKQIVTQNINRGDVKTDIAAAMKEYIENGKKPDDVYEEYGMLDKVHRLREVRIKARKPAPPPYSNQFIRLPEGSSDQVIMMDPSDTVNTSLATWLSLKAKRIFFKERIIEGMQIPLYPYVKLPFIPKPVPLSIVLDGRKVDSVEAYSILEGFQIQPEAVYKAEIVLTSVTSLQILDGPTLMIFTKRDYVRKNYTPSVANFKPKGFNKVREFYSPKYEQPEQSKLPDLRTTVCWNPYLKTDVNGKTAFKFYNADGPASYKVIVEGINADGELGRQVYRYTVDANPLESNMPANAGGIMLTGLNANRNAINRR